MTILTQGSFTSTGAGKYIDVPSSADYFKTVNLTAMAAAGTECVAGEWFRDLTPQNDGLRWRKAGTHAILIDNFSTATASNGFSYYEAPPTPTAALTGTTITDDSPAVCSVANTYSDGDTVRIYDSTGMLQIAGLPFTISSVSSTEFTLLGLNANSFAAPASAFKVRKIDPFYGVSPQFFYVTEITQATNGVVRTSQAHDYVVGQLLKMSIPSDFGMVELDQVTVQVTAVDTYTFTIDVNTSGYTAFAFPASSASPNIEFASVGPVGQRAVYDSANATQLGYNTSTVPFRNNDFTPRMFLAGGSDSPAGASNDTIVWQCYKMTN